MLEVLDGYVVVMKEDCPTCQLVAPLLPELARDGASLMVYSQDDPHFPATVTGVRLDETLDVSYRLGIEFVPTVVQFVGGKEVNRLVGWQREAWREVTGIGDLGEGLAASRPGCGALNTLPGYAEDLAIRHGDAPMTSRLVEIGELEDPIEACYQRGWSDGLPVVPPTQKRVLQMLQGTSRRPDEVVAIMPTNQTPVTVEKVAINAVLAGCKPAYLPVVLAAVEAICDEAFCLVGICATTWYSYPIVVVNGPVTQAIGMNSGFNVLGQGNRANGTIGRAVNLVLRNVGEVRPGEIDRATMGQPGKYTFCFAEAEADTTWRPLSVERGVPDGVSAVTVFAGEAGQPIADQRSRTPEALARSLADGLDAVYRPNVVLDSDVLLVVSPEHSRVFEEAGWSKARLIEELEQLTQGETDGGKRTKFREGGILLVRAGSPAGMYSTILPGWPVSAKKGASPVTKVVKY